jgi:hypothetical protein
MFNNMLKRFLGILVLFSITTHSASRLGLVSYLFEHRQEIAYSLGLIGEIPIALCNSDYDFENGVKITSPDSDLRMPGFAMAHEINLFFVAGVISCNLQNMVSSCKASTIMIDRAYLSPVSSIFHPPSIQA